MKIMHVDASAKRERSNSRALSQHFLERLREEGLDIEVDYLDVTVDTPLHVNEAFAIATYAPSHERTPAMKARRSRSQPQHWNRTAMSWHSARSSRMKIRTLTATVALAGLSLAGLSPTVFAADTAAGRETITPAFTEAIANVPGKTMTALVVDYPPGGKSLPHRHGQAFVVGYVLSGAIRSRINNGEEHVFHAGESWTEKPGAHHTVSENASDTEPAKLLAIFVADTKDKKLVTFDKQ